MHLGLNLRKAFIQQKDNTLTVETGMQNNSKLDVFIHEFCKLFGSHGTPEYAVGCVQFSDFLSYKVHQSDAGSHEQLYYRSCLSVTLSRQVGSRYFVSSYNAVKITPLNGFVNFLKKSKN